MTEIGWNAENVVIDLLGGPSVLQVNPSTFLHWAELVGRGVPAHSAHFMAHMTGMSHADISRATGLSKRTFTKKQLDQRLSSHDSVRLLRLACVIARATETFEGKAAALDWLRSPNPALSHDIPLWMLTTKEGAEDVLLVLGRIEHGVFA